MQDSYFNHEVQQGITALRVRHSLVSADRSSALHLLLPSFLKCLKWLPEQPIRTLRSLMGMELANILTGLPKMIALSGNA